MALQESFEWNYPNSTRKFNKITIFVIYFYIEQIVLLSYIQYI